MVAHRIPVNVPTATHTSVRVINCQVQVLDSLAETREILSYVRFSPHLRRTAAYRIPATIPMNINLISEGARSSTLILHTTIPCTNRYNLYWSVLVN